MIRLLVAALLWAVAMACWSFAMALAQAIVVMRHDDGRTVSDVERVKVYVTFISLGVLYAITSIISMLCR